MASICGRQNLSDDLQPVRRNTVRDLAPTRMWRLCNDGPLDISTLGLGHGLPFQGYRRQLFRRIPSSVTSIMAPVSRGAEP